MTALIDKQDDEIFRELLEKIRKEYKNILKLFLLFFGTIFIFWPGIGFSTVNLSPLDVWLLNYYPLWFIIGVPFLLGYILALVPAFVGAYFHITKLLISSVQENSEKSKSSNIYNHTSESSLIHTLKRYTHRLVWYFIVSLFYLFPSIFLILIFHILSSTFVPLGHDFLASFLMYIARKSGYTGYYYNSFIPGVFIKSFSSAQLLSATTALYLNYRALKKKGTFFL